jgi:hypothetical protein
MTLSLADWTDSSSAIEISLVVWFVIQEVEQHGPISDVISRPTQQQTDSSAALYDTARTVRN